MLFWVLFRLGLGNFKGWFRSNLGFCQDFLKAGLGYLGLV